MRTICSAREYGSGLRSTPSTALKIAVLAPIPMASVRIAAIANPGAERSVLRAKWRSCPRSLRGRVASDGWTFDVGFSVARDIQSLPDRIISFDAGNLQRVALWRRNHRPPFDRVHQGVGGDDRGVGEALAFHVAKVNGSLAGHAADDEMALVVQVHSWLDTIDRESAADIVLRSHGSPVVVGGLPAREHSP